MISGLALIKLNEFPNQNWVEETELAYLEADQREYHYIISHNFEPVGYAHIDTVEIFDFLQGIEPEIFNNAIYLAYIELYEKGILRNSIELIKSYFGVKYICAESSDETLDIWEHIGAVYFKDNNRQYITYEHRSEQHPFVI